MIADNSAVMAILQGEPEAEDFARRMASAPSVSVSVMGIMECTMLELSRRGDHGVRNLEAVPAGYSVAIIEVSLEQGRLAIEAFRH